MMFDSHFPSFSIIFSPYACHMFGEDLQLHVTYQLIIPWLGRSSRHLKAGRPPSLVLIDECLGQGPGAPKGSLCGRGWERICPSNRWIFPGFVSSRVLRFWNETTSGSVEKNVQCQTTWDMEIHGWLVSVRVSTCQYQISKTAIINF